MVADEALVRVQRTTGKGHGLDQSRSTGEPNLKEKSKSCGFSRVSCWPEARRRVPRPAFELLEPLDTRDYRPESVLDEKEEKMEQTAMSRT